MSVADKKKALRMFQYGLFIITSKATRHFDKTPFAASTVTWVSQASFEPPLISVALRKEGWVNEAIRQSKLFALNILGEGQKSVAMKFFKDIHVEGKKINGFEFHTETMGMPLIDICPAWLECHVEERFDKGDHSILIAKIISAKVNRVAEPMLLRNTGWNYGG